ncbi:hypothetical protein Q1695_013133 [Nippostrongylus brasiliensis]|nr:hypothetical protein Q1695_013133 [Nippostrongylus brasiliensis]
MVDNTAFIAAETAAHHDEAVKGGKARTVSTDGEIADGYQIVKDVFIENFVGKREHHGAALAVYHKGKLVVDLWGGVADRVGGKQWNKNTYASIFCCTKSLAAICMAMKVDRGECSYTDKVTKYWPEFGRNDKNDITIEMILTHRAGLPNFDADFTLAEVTPEKISKIIEAESPKYMPGTKTSYHAITYGWLIDQLFCRIDKRQRSISDFFHDEIQKKHGVEVSVGTSPELEELTAKFPPVTKRITLRDYIHDRKIFSISNYLKKSTKEISRMRLKNEASSTNLAGEC